MAYLALNLGFLKTLAFFAIAQCGCGIFLALVFGLGHNGMATYDADARPDFWKLQVCATTHTAAVVKLCADNCVVTAVKEAVLAGGGGGGSFYSCT